MATKTLATIGVLSIGDMGLGIAKRLKATGFSVATNCRGRSQDTVDRAKAAGVDIMPSDVALAGACDVILSVVPPRDSEATADRIIDALSTPGTRKADAAPLYFADMNAVAPSTVKTIAAAIKRAKINAVLVDGSIIGGPPSLKESSPEGEWYLPSMPLSGPEKLLDLPYGEALGKALRMYHISADIGAASGLKMCFASLSKGFTAIAVQSWTTAQRMGVLGDLKDVLGTMMPARLTQAQNGLVGMAPKAYRWVREMEEISKTFAEEGGFEPYLFQGAAGVYKTVAEDTVLGEEKIGRRKRGTTADDIAAAMSEGMQAKRKKTE